MIHCTPDLHELMECPSIEAGSFQYSYGLLFQIILTRLLDWCIIRGLKDVVRGGGCCYEVLLKIETK